MADLIAVGHNHNFNKHIHNPNRVFIGFASMYDASFEFEDSEGWHFGAGDPELHKYSAELIKPGDRVLDLGSGEGRNSLLFALNGMRVDCYDANPEALSALENTASFLSHYIPCEICTSQRDILNTSFGNNKYHLVVLANIVHLPSKQEAFELFDRSYDSLKAGGYMWLRVASKISSAYEELRQAEEYDPYVTIRDQDIVEHPCTCSGTYKIEPTLFFDPVDVLHYVKSKGMDVVHSQHLGLKGERNIMYGEDYQTGQSLGVDDVSGHISILAKKT